MEETHKDADRTKGRTLRRLSKLEGPLNGNNTWEVQKGGKKVYLRRRGENLTNALKDRRLKHPF